MEVALTILKWIAIVLSPLIISFIIIFSKVLVHIIIGLKKGKKIGKKGTYKKPSFFKRLFIQFPDRLVKDMFSRKDYEFNEYGLHMVCGEQGSGKTTTVVHLLKKWEQLYPKVRVASNMAYKGEHNAISHWKDVVKNSNGVFGQVEVIDEIQTWFSSLQSKDFPPEMITEVSQQRKQRKCILGTAQVFSRIAKPIREQTTFVYLPMTLFGCLTIVRVSKAIHWDNENQKFKKYLGWFFFVHTDEIRNSFDTYKKIDKYTKDGFKSDLERLQGNQSA